jgi:hypothetical protein
MLFLDVCLGHVGGLPIEELAPLAGGTGLLAARELWVRLRARMKR